MKTLPPLQGLHHVTAVTANAPGNLDFYTRVLGLRLVKKTVNQDDVSAYHLFYADALGTAGTDVTFFDWSSAIPARPGAGVVSETALRVLGDAKTLDAWVDWFDRNGVPHGPVEPAAGPHVASLAFQDPEGQRLRLLAQPRSEARGEFHPWKGHALPLENAIVGLGGVSLTVQSIEGTARLLTETLGFRAHAQDPALFETGHGGPGAQLRLETSTTPGFSGAGGVHHVAWMVADPDELRAWERRLGQNGVRNSGLVDRHYFQSLYFRIPGGILFELATAGPGFTADGEELEKLGERLSLPPFLEPRRAAIEAGLQPLEYQPVHTT